MEHLQMAENPDQQKALGEGRLDIPRTKWGQDSQYTCGHFV